MNEKLEIVNSTGGVLLTLFGGFVAPEDNGKILVSVTGWDTVERDFETVDKLIGNGSYLVSSHVGARTLQISGILFDTEVNRAFARTMQDLVMSAEKVTVRRTFSGSETSIESIDGMVSTVKEMTFMYGGTPSLALSFTVLCLDPEIVVA